MLGGGELAKGLVGAFQNLGLEVHVVDRYEGSPAQQVAHFSYTADIDDEKAVLDLVEHVKPAYVVPEIEGVADEALQALQIGRASCRERGESSCVDGGVDDI